MFISKQCIVKCTAYSKTVVNKSSVRNMLPSVSDSPFQRDSQSEYSLGFLHCNQLPLSSFITFFTFLFFNGLRGFNLLYSIRSNYGFSGAGVKQESFATFFRQAQNFLRATQQLTSVENSFSFLKYKLAANFNANAGVR